MAGKLPERKPRIKVDRFGRTALWDAAFGGDIAKVKRYLAAGVNPNWGDNEGYTPLYIAAQQGHLVVVELLLDHGADPNLVDFNGMGPLYVAALEGSKVQGTDRHLAIAALLLRKGADPDHKNRWGVTPRSWADAGKLGPLFATVECQVGGASKSWRAEPPPKKPRKADWWKKEHSRLWDELVPPSGPAKTVQGEVIRVVGKLTREAYTNGNINWDKSCALMWRFVARTLDDPGTFSPEERARINEWVRIIIRDHEWPDVSGDGSPYYLVGEKAVAWVLAHPGPIPHTPDPRLIR
jgi:hypothetical protein